MAAGLGFVVLAALMLFLRGRSPVVRAAVLAFVTQGAIYLTGAFGLLADSAGDADFWFRVYPYFIFAEWPAELYFLSLFPAPRTRLANARWWPAPFFAAMVALSAVYVFDRGLWGVPGPPGVPGGPLWTFSIALLYLTHATVALVLARDYLRVDAPMRGPVLLVAGAIGAVTLFDVAGASARVALGLPAVLSALPAAALLLGSVAFVARARRSADAALRRGANLFLGAYAIAAASGVAAVASGSVAVDAFAAGFWRFSQPLVVSYAVLRHRFLDIELKVKWTIKQSTIAAAFIGMFFVVSESASTFASGSLGPYLGIAAAGLLVFALAPLQRAAERVASAAMPGVRAVHDMTPGQRAEAYLAQVTMAWADGSVSADERELLDASKARLGLSADEAARLERVALQAYRSRQARGA